MKTEQRERVNIELSFKIGKNATETVLPLKKTNTGSESDGERDWVDC